MTGLSEGPIGQGLFRWAARISFLLLSGIKCLIHYMTWLCALHARQWCWVPFSFSRSVQSYIKSKKKLKSSLSPCLSVRISVCVCVCGRVSLSVRPPVCATISVEACEPVRVCVLEFEVFLRAIFLSVAAVTHFRLLYSAVLHHFR